MTKSYKDKLAAARALKASLSDRLAATHAASRRNAPDYDRAVDRLVARLVEAGAGDTAPAVGDAFPALILPDERGRLHRLEALWSEGPLVVAVMRGVWCPYCRVTLATLAEAAERVRAAGGSIIAIAPQRATWGAEHAADAGADFPVLADAGGGAIALLGLAIPLGDEIPEFYRKGKIDLAEINGDAGALLPIPATFVIAPDGRVAARFVDPDHRHRMEIEAIVEAVAQAASSR